jgi:hypothetical protein
MIRTGLLLLVISGCFTRSASQPPAEWKSFADTAGMFTAQYPSTWKNKIKEGNRVFFTSPPENDKDSFFENVNISVTQNPAYGTSVKITDLFPLVTEQLKPAFRDFKSESQRFFKWNNMDACEIIYSGYNKMDESLRVRMTQWFCFYKTRLYTVTYTAVAGNTAYTETAKKIMSSIVFK